MNGFKKTLLSTAAVVLGVAMSVSVAQAVPLSGSVAFNGGTYTPENSAGTQVALGSATQIDFLSNTLNVTGSSGDIAAAGIVSGVTGSIKDFSFSPLAVIPSNPLFTIGSLTFDLQNISVLFQNNNVLALSGSGVLKLAGYTDTQGQWDFTANASGSSFSWSGGAAVPEPSTMILMGSGLVGLGLWRKFKK